MSLILLWHKITKHSIKSFNTYCVKFLWWCNLLLSVYIKNILNYLSINYLLIDKFLGLQCPWVGETRSAKGKIDDWYANVRQIFYSSWQNKIRYRSSSLRWWFGRKFHKRARLLILLRGIINQLNFFFFFLVHYDNVN